MAAGKYDIGPRIGIEGEKEYRNQLSSINDSIRLLSSEMEKSAVTFNKNNDSMEALTATSKNLEAMYESQSKKVQTMQEALEKAKNEYGENSKEVMKYQTSLNSAETALGKTGNALQEVNEKLEEGKKKSGSWLNKISSDSKKLEGAFTTASIAVGALAAGIAATIKGTQEFRMDMSKLETNALQAGEKVDDLNSEMTKLNAITGETDSNVEGLSNLLAAGFTGSSLTQVINDLSGAIIKFPDTLKIESLADSLQETLATGSATGQFSELLGRMGVDVDKFNSGLQSCTSSTQKQEYALKTLNDLGLSQTYELYRKNNDELFKAADIQFKFQQATAQMGKSLTEAFVAISPVLIPLIDGMARLVAVISKIPAPVLATMTTLAAMIPVTLAVLRGVNTVTTFLGASANPAMIKTTLIIMGVVTALVALAAIIAVIQGRGKELQSTMGSVGNAMNSTQRSVPHYAVGTQFHQGGLALVGENGPEIVQMPRGSKVYTNEQSRNMGNSAVINNYNTFKVDDIETYQRIKKSLENERISQRAGYVSG